MKMTEVNSVLKGLTDAFCSPVRLGKTSNLALLKNIFFLQ